MYIIVNFLFAIRKSVLKSFFSKFLYVLEYKKRSHHKFKIFHFFTKFWVSEIIVKKNIAEIENKKRFYKNKYTFKDGDWFSHNIPVWDIVINREINTNQELNYLEIGAYEGRSVIHICEQFRLFKITVVDPYIEYKELNKYVKKQNMEQTFNILKKNLISFQDRTEILRLTSDKFFEKNKKEFDIIYIDGSHHSKDVKKDFENSIKIIKKNGIIILDDFTWNHYKNINENPIGGIFPVLENNPHLKIVSASNQLIIKN